MKIREYLTARDLTVAAFAEQIGVGRVIVHRWMSGGATPSLESAAKIVEVTGGEVTIADLLAPSSTPAVEPAPAADPSTDAA